MLKRPTRFLFLAVVVSAVSLYWGCSQPDDILLDKTQTTILLQAERFPTTPAGMVYELWVVDGLVDDSLFGAQSIERFTYDFTTGLYYDENGVERSDGGLFKLQDDILRYAWLAITVQRSDDPSGTVGPVMLIDTITDSWAGPIDLAFPQNDSLYNTAAYFSMKITSLDNPDVADYGSSIWFNTVIYDSVYFQETLALDTFFIDTIWVDTLGDDLMRTSVTNVLNARDTIVDRGFGLDTVQQQAIRYDIETHIADALEPDSSYTVTTIIVDTVIVDIDTTITTDTTITLITFWLTTRIDIEFETGPITLRFFDDYVQIGHDVKDVSSYGWKYQGWIVSPVVEAAGVSVGQMSLPAWSGYTNPSDSLIHGIDGGLISTGLFTSLYSSDESNPYSSDEHVTPLFPGEDFLVNLPGSNTGPVRLAVGGETDSLGTVFITLEPSNRLSDTTNFPLIVMSRILPEVPIAVQALSQSFVMWNRTGYNRNVTIGFPRVHVEINRM